MGGDAVREKLVWSDEFSIGVRALDQQHRALIRLVNSLAECVGSADERAVVSETLTGVIQFAKVHFGDEERLMAEHDYPQFAEHRESHAQFLLKAVDFTSAHALRVAGVPERLHEFLATWWTDHILDEDLKFGEFLQRKQTRHQAK